MARVVPEGRARDQRLVLAVLAVILLGAAALRLWGLQWGLFNATVSRRPHPDEWVVYWVFHWFGQYRDLTPCPRPSGQCFFDWGALFLYLGYAVHGVLQPLLDQIPRSAMGARADPQFVQAALSGRITSALLSIGTVYLTFRLGRTISRPAVGLVAAGFVALSGLLIELAHFATPDSTTIFFLTAALWAAAAHVRGSDRRSLIWAGVLAGLAAGSEYNMALLAMPLLAAWLLAQTRPLSWLVWTGLAMGAAWIAVNPYALIESSAFIQAGLHSLRTRTVDSQIQYGDRWSHYGPPWLYVIRYPLGYGVGFASTAWMVAGVLWALLRHRRLDLVLLAWVVPYFLLVTFSPAKFMRYSAPLLPAMSVLAAELIVVLVLFGGRWPRLVALGASLLALLYTAGYDVAYARLFSQPDTRTQAAYWIRVHAAPGTKIAFQEIPDGLLNLPEYVVFHRYRPCFSRFSVRRLSGPARYILVDSYEREAHGLIPGVQVHRFLTALERDRQYRRVARLQHVPSVGPWSFPIANSPHDWRYAAHIITIYAHSVPGTAVGQYCFPTLPQAVKALYVPPPD